LKPGGFFRHAASKYFYLSIIVFKIFCSHFQAKKIPILLDKICLPREGTNMDTAQPIDSIKYKQWYGN